MADNVIGLFRTPDAALAASASLRDAGLVTAEIQSPYPLHGVEAVLGRKKSVIKQFTLFGGITGALSGFILAAGTAVLFPHPTGGRPLITIPPYLIITYEMTILFGILATVLGFLISSRLPAIRARIYVPEAAVDRFAVVLPCESADETERAKEVLQAAGAVETRVESGEGL